MKTFGGQVLFLDRSDINTDEIIPAKYLTEITKEALQPYLLEDLKLEGFHPQDVREKSVILTRANFGCGSSREHAPWALEVNGIHAVVAENFARIFRQNMYNCGMLALELPAADIEAAFRTFSGTETRADFDLGAGTLTLDNGKARQTYSFHLGGFEKALVESGGWVEFADQRY